MKVIVSVDVTKVYDVRIQDSTLDVVTYRQRNLVLRFRPEVIQFVTSGLGEPPANVVLSGTAHSPGGWPYTDTVRTNTYKAAELPADVLAFLVKRFPEVLWPQ